jgi:hypothetical protein
MISLQEPRHIAESKNEIESMNNKVDTGILVIRYAAIANPAKHPSC